MTFEKKERGRDLEWEDDDKRGKGWDPDRATWVKPMQPCRHSEAARPTPCTGDIRQQKGNRHCFATAAKEQCLQQQKNDVSGIRTHAVSD